LPPAHGRAGRPRHIVALHSDAVQSNDPIDRAALKQAAALANALNLWYGDLALLMRNFTHDGAVVEHWLPTTSVASPAPRPEVLRAREAVRAIVRPAAGATVQELTTLGVTLARCNPQNAADVTPLLRVCDADEAYRTLEQHLAASWQLGRGGPAVRALIDMFASSGHRFWCAQGTTIFVAAPSLERIALIGYQGDGP
jgi:hypothetical protein